MKKVNFTGKRPSIVGANADDWVGNQPAETKEVMKRLTIDVPVSLHKRIKTQCAQQDKVMADVIRDILEQTFPASVGPGVPT